MPPIVANLYARGASGAPSTTLLQLPLWPLSISHTKSAFGGDESATIVARVPAQHAAQWVEQLQSAVILADGGGTRCWQGFIARIQVDDGSTVISRTLDGMANEVYVQYLRYGVARTTSAATSASSVATYGRHMALISVDEMDATAAAARAASYLALYAWPIEEASASITRQPPGLATLTLECKGWFEATKWIVYSLQQGTGTTTISDTNWRGIAGAINLSLNDATFGNNYSVNISATPFTAGGVNLPMAVYTGVYRRPFTKSYETAADVIARLAALGDGANERATYGFLTTRVDNAGAITWKASTWAGAVPTAVSYYLTPDGQLLTNAMTQPRWASVLPDTMIRRLRLAARPAPSDASDTISRFWCARTEYTWDGQAETLRLEPGRGGGADILLARVR